MAFLKEHGRLQWQNRERFTTRYEVAPQLRPGQKIVFNQTVSDKLRGLEKVSKFFNGKHRKKKELNPVTFAGLAGFELGVPCIRIITEGKVLIVPALGYTFWRNHTHGASIVERKSCALRERFETTLNNHHIARTSSLGRLTQISHSV